MDLRKIPLRIKFELYEEVLDMKLKGFTIPEIQENLFSKFGIKSTTKTFYRWAAARNKPDGLLKRFMPKPTPELSYLIGVLFGDGYLKSKNYKYIFGLKVKDLDFAQSFAQKVSTILENKVKCTVRKEKDITRGNKTRFCSEVSNRMLYEFLRLSDEKLLVYALLFPKEFLQGLFDSDGFTAISAKTNFNVGVGLASAEPIILNIVKSILEDKFQIQSRISKSMLKGEKVYIWGKEYKANKDVFVLNISSFEDVRKFSEKIGFSLNRKQPKLIEAIYIKQNFATQNAIKIWQKTYKKTKREWVKKEEIAGTGIPGVLLHLNQ